MQKDNAQDKPAKTQRQGAARGGRPSLAGVGVSAALVVRVTDAQRAKYDARGGAQWLRRLIDAA